MDWGFPKQQKTTSHAEEWVVQVGTRQQWSPPRLHHRAPPVLILCKRHAFIDPQHRQDACRWHQAVFKDKIHGWLQPPSIRPQPTSCLVSEMAPGLQWNQVRSHEDPRKRQVRIHTKWIQPRTSPDTKGLRGANVRLPETCQPHPGNSQES